MSVDLDLTERTVLLTGATGGIGEAILRLLSRAGATVAVHYSSNGEKARDLAKEAGNGSAPFQADLAREEEAGALFGRVLEHYGKVDVLINNAGVFIASPVNDPQRWVRDWHRTMAINLTAPAILCRNAIQHFLDQNGGRIINISSRAAWRGDTPEHLDYASSKGGMIALTKSIARGWGREGVVAFNVAPGFVRTPMAEQVTQEKGEGHLLEELSLSRLTEPEDLAPTVLYLASGTMDHATGSTIDVNGGSYVR
ncbi:MAG: SDR family NAD(P)-dependent oxidoreductase [Flavobacteriales bacterium]